MFFDIQCVELFSIIILETGSGAFFGSALPTKAFFGSALPTKLHCSSRILKAIWVWTVPLEFKGTKLVSWKAPLSGMEHPVQLQAGPATLGTGLPAAWGGEKRGSWGGEILLEPEPV